MSYEYSSLEQTRLEKMRSFLQRGESPYPMPEPFLAELENMTDEEAAELLAADCDQYAPADILSK